MRPVLPTSTTVTVVLDFPGNFSADVLQHMKREVETLAGLQGVGVDWRQRSDLTLGESFSDLVMIRFRGECRLSPMPEMWGDERGPYAWTHVTDGNVLPYSEVSCDLVRKRVRQVMHGSDFSRRDVLMGRALGRVVMHELLHMVSKSCLHEKHGVMRHALAPSELIAEHIEVMFRHGKPDSH